MLWSLMWGRRRQWRTSGFKMWKEFTPRRLLHSDQDFSYYKGFVFAKLGGCAALRRLVRAHYLMFLQLFSGGECHWWCEEPACCYQRWQGKERYILCSKVIGFFCLHLLIISSFYGIWVCINTDRLQLLSWFVPGSAREDYHGAEEKETHRIQVNPKPSAVFSGVVCF